MTISTHAPRTGSDGALKPGSLVKQFQPTLPARGATGEQYATVSYVDISTHAPRTGSDRFYQHANGAIRNFNPRSPHGERLEVMTLGVMLATFQPTLPARGATPHIRQVLAV